ncbi:hypothetical protein ACFL16_03720, partial [Patescibacteria group bacterium]
MIKREELHSFSTYLLVEEAQKRGIKVSKIFPETKTSHLVFEFNGKVCVMIGQAFQNLTFCAYRICINKEMTRTFLRKAGISTTEGRKFSAKKTKEAFLYVQEIGFPIVVKPTKGIWGKDVFLNLNSIEQVKSSIEAVLERTKSFLIEKQFSGDEYRILATKDKVLGIINRVPANIIGDGEKTVAELIKLKNQDP